MRPLRLERGLRTERMAVPGARRLVGVLALTETVSFGALLYAFSVLLLPMERELGASRGALSAALAAAAVARAIAAPIVGGWVDRRGVRWLMTTGSFAGAGLVWAWSEVSSVTELLVVFIGIGVVGAMVFYEIDAANVAAYKRRGHDLPSSAQREGAGILPLQAIHRINQQRQVRFAFVSADYIT